MKKIISNITVVLFALLAMTACTDDNVSDLRLNGDCSVMAFAADEYEGTIDADKKVITVRVPETYNTESMTVTKLTLSDGAESNIKQGDVLNLAYPQVIHVANGNVSLDWTVNVKRDEAKILSFRINDTYTDNHLQRERHYNSAVGRADKLHTAGRIHCDKQFGTECLHRHRYAYRQARGALCRSGKHNGSAEY